IKCLGVTCIASQPWHGPLQDAEQTEDRCEIDGLERGGFHLPAAAAHLGQNHGSLLHERGNNDNELALAVRYQFYAYPNFTTVHILPVDPPTLAAGIERPHVV